MEPRIGGDTERGVLCRIKNRGCIPEIAIKYVAGSDLTKIYAAPVSEVCDPWWRVGLVRGKAGAGGPWKIINVNERRMASKTPSESEEDREHECFRCSHNYHNSMLEKAASAPR